MNCREARRLLDQGLTPGSSSADRAELGFHLVSCPNCRAYRAARDQRLLSSMLAQDWDASPPSSKATAAPPRPQRAIEQRNWRTSVSKALWYGALGLLATIFLGTAITVVWAVLSVVHIHQNVQAMIVPTERLILDSPTAPASATALAEPTLTPQPSQPPATPTVLRPSATPQPTTPPPTATPAVPAAGAPITVLLLGSDQRPGETAAPRTDSVMVARIDPRSRRVALLSLPRDLWVEIPGYGHTRINAAYVWGITYGEPGGGMALARKTVSNLLGIPIDYTIYIDFEGFIGAIDKLGGITVNVEKELYDSRFPTMDYGYTVVHFLAGSQHMDGTTALTYSRIRHPDSDFARMRRQQAVLLGVLARLREQNALATLKSLEDLTAALRGYVRTDIPEERLIGLAWALRDFSPDQVEQYQLGPNMVSFGVGDDRWAAVAQPGAIDELVRKLLDTAVQ